MTSLRLEIDLEKIRSNAQTLVERLAAGGISVMGITKAALGCHRIAGAMLRGGVSSLGDSRIENIEAMRKAGVKAEMMLTRTPMLSQIERVVASADVSLNTEIDAVAMLSAAAVKAGRTHGVMLMAELGDLREGIMPCNLDAVARKVLRFPNIELRGIGGNLACHSGVSPSPENMAVLSALADRLEVSCHLGIVSGGNSANLDWALGRSDTGRINNLRLGESILLGRNPLSRRPIRGLHTDAITLVAEVIEHTSKPSMPWGDKAQSAFGQMPVVSDRGYILRAILAVGRQDTDPDGLRPPWGTEILGASSDHLVLETGGDAISVGSEMTFQVNYSALLRAMTSPFVDQVIVRDCRREIDTPALPAV